MINSYLTTISAIIRSIYTQYHTHVYAYLCNIVFQPDKIIIVGETIIWAEIN